MHIRFSIGESEPIFIGDFFLTKNVLLKGEYVAQKYKDFPVTDFRSGGRFNGFVVEAVVGF